MASFFSNLPIFVISSFVTFSIFAINLSISNSLSNKLKLFSLEVNERFESRLSIKELINDFLAISNALSSYVPLIVFLMI